jgi:hypothetical protein
MDLSGSFGYVSLQVVSVSLFNGLASFSSIPFIHDVFIALSPNMKQRHKGKNFVSQPLPRP